MFSSILVVCTGNICRSPMGEHLLRDRWRKPGARVSSAGIAALVGYPADEHAIAVMQEHGIDVGEHRARQLNSELAFSHDLILFMDTSHERWIQTRLPAARGRVYAMTKWLPQDEVPDPYMRGRNAFEQTYAELDAAVNSWLQRLD